MACSMKGVVVFVAVLGNALVASGYLNTPRVWSKDSPCVRAWCPQAAQDLSTRGALSGCFRLRMTSGGTDAHGKLSDIFREEFSSAVNQLSDTSIVEMIPSESTLEGEAPFRQQMFTSPLIPLLYERILPPVWAAGLRVGGMDEEYAEVAEFLQGDGSGTVLDLSCGTGFIARRLAASRCFQHVVALDYSREMLEQLLGELAQQRKGWNPPNLAPGSLSVVRGDAGRLPFKDDSLDAVHWGAAMHCVPSAETALSEVRRVLKPGGKLYATTFLRPLPDVVFRFFTLEELKELALGAGFGVGGAAEVDVRQLGPVYGVLRVVK